MLVKQIADIGYNITPNEAFFVNGEDGDGGGGDAIGYIHEWWRHVYALRAYIRGLSNDTILTLSSP